MNHADYGSDAPDESLDRGDDAGPIRPALCAKFDALPPSIREMFSLQVRRDERALTRTQNCAQALRHNGFTLAEAIELARHFPQGYGYLRTQAAKAISDWWAALGAADAERARGPDFGETLPLAMFDTIKPSLIATDFVEGLLQSASMVVVYGEPGSRKTFFVLDLCLHVAAGRSWRDQAVEQGAVIYLALEGGAGIRNRIAAARQRMNLPATTPLALVQCPVDLCHADADLAKVIATIKLVAHRVGLPVRLVVVDTLSRALAGGSENGPEDMGALVVNTDHIRGETGACVLYIHHSGKDAARGARGHSLLKAACDTEIEVTAGPDVSVARVSRQRELDSGDSFAFRLDQAALGQDQRGKPVTSCVVGPVDVPAAPAERVHLTDNERIALRTLDQAMTADGILATVFDGDTEGSVVREADWRRWFYREGRPGADQETKQKAFRRVVAGLLAKGRIGTRDDFVWPKSI